MEEKKKTGGKTIKRIEPSTLNRNIKMVRSKTEINEDNIHEDKRQEKKYMQTWFFRGIDYRNKRHLISNRRRAPQTKTTRSKN